MKNNLMYICLTLWCGLLGYAPQATAAPKSGERDSTRSAISTIPPTDAAPISVRSFPELEQYLKENNLYEPSLLHQGYAAPEFTEGYIAQNFMVSAFIADARQEAQATMTEVERKNNYTDYLSNSDLVDLPVGMKKKLGNSTVTIGVSKAKFYPNYTELTVFCKIDLPQGKSIFFGANNIKLSQSGGLIGDANLVLLGDFAIPINGGNSMITLKGGMDMATGNALNLTYAKLQCGGVKEVGILADITFPRSLLTPLNADYTVVSDPNTKVKGSFKTVVSDWNDILAGVSLPPFALKGLEKVAFKLDNAVIDLSDKRNDGTTVFPQGYGNLVPGNEGLWRGVYIRQVTVVLPPEFKNRGSSNRITFTGEKLLIDNWGFTGIVSGLNIMQTGTATGWDFSLDKFTIEVQSNRLRSAGFEGAIALPVSKRTSPNVKDYGLPYKAIFSADNGYLMSVSVQNELDFSLWQAKAKLLSGSYIELVVKDNKFRPKAFLNGNINVNHTDANFQGVAFQGLQLQTESPYIQAQYFGYQSQSKLANFPITINQLSLSTNASNEVALTVGAQINLMEGDANKLSAGTTISIVGQMTPSEEQFGFDYKRLDVSNINIDGTFKDAFSVTGFVNFYKNHAIMGNGFAGNLKMKLLTGDNIGINATAAFGSKDFRYWYVDVMATGLNLPIGGGFIITGLGGGASYKMKKNTTSTDPSVCASGIGYDPDANTGLGLRAMTQFKVGGKQIATGDASLDILFTSSGGLARVGLHGNAIILPSGAVRLNLGNLTAVKDKVSSKLKSLTEKINIDPAKYKNLLGEGKFGQAAKDYDVNVNYTDGGGSITAQLGIEYDFLSKVLDGNFEVKVNLANGMIRGIGTDYVAGWAKIRFAPNTWYIHAGTPQNPLGVNIDIPLTGSIKTTTYFMVGDSVGISPAPPSEVANILGAKMQALDYMRNYSDLGTGRGMAFGTRFSAAAQVNTIPLFYANFNAGIGFDIMVRDYGDKRCQNNPYEAIGMNGWYANGQAYAYLQGELGIKVNLWFIKGNVPIVKAGAATLLQTRLPKPTWLSGRLGGYYSLLGGRVKGNFSCGLVVGEPCNFINETGTGSGSSMDLITDFVPANGEEEVDVLGVPQVVFRMPLDAPYLVETDLEVNESGDQYVGARLESFTITKDGVPLIGQLNWNKTRESVFFETADALPSNSTLKAVVKVGYYNIQNGYNWIPQYRYEQKEFTFKTGAAPTGIPLSNIEFTYPAINQKYFLPREYNQGFAKLKKGQSYLLSTGMPLKAKFTGSNGSQLIVNANYNIDTKYITYTLPSLSNNTSYKIEIYTDQVLSTQTDYSKTSLNTTTETSTSGESTMTVTTNTSTGLVTKSGVTLTNLLVYNFGTSQYGTFTEKMQAKGDSYYFTEDAGIGSAGVSLSKYVNWSEPFDGTDLKGSRYTSTKPLIQAEAILGDNSYYNNYMYPIVYSWMGNEGLVLNREVPDLGTPPSKAIQVSSRYLAALESNNGDIYSTYYTFPYQYNLVKFYYSDYNQLQTAALERYGTMYEQCQWVNYGGYGSSYGYNDYYGGYYGGYYDGYYECNMVRPYPDYLINIIEGYFPSMSTGTYKAQFRYVLPNNVQTSTYDSNFNY